MKKVAAIMFCLAALLTAEEKAPPRTGKKVPSAKLAKAKAPQAPKPLTIPEGAVEVQPGLWEHKDDQGKTWHYTRTPFGVRKFEPENIADAPAKEAGYITAIDDGSDTIRFERQMPFGKMRWTRKRSELNAAEKIAVQKAAKAVRE
jgi:hypothetical protein